MRKGEMVSIQDSDTWEILVGLKDRKGMEKDTKMKRERDGSSF
jgi:hypothetical protein